MLLTTVDFSLSVNINLRLAICSTTQNQVNIKCALNAQARFAALDCIWTSRCNALT